MIWKHNFDRFLIALGCLLASSNKYKFISGTENADQTLTWPPPGACRKEWTFCYKFTYISNATLEAQTWDLAEYWTGLDRFGGSKPSKPSNTSNFPKPKAHAFSPWRQKRLSLDPATKSEKQTAVRTTTKHDIVQHCARDPRPWHLFHTNSARSTKPNRNTKPKNKIRSAIPTILTSPS